MPHKVVQPASSSSIVPHIDASNPRDELLNRIKGKEVIVPDIFALFKGWRQAVNPHLEQGRVHLKNWFSDRIINPKIIRKLEIADFALIVGGFYADAPMEKYLVLLEYIAWIFTFDDEIDCGKLQHDGEATLKSAVEMLHCLSLCLSRDTPPGTMLTGSKIARDLYAIGLKFRAGSPPDVAERIRQEIVGYVVEAAIEQAARHSPQLPSMEAFVKSRHLSGAARPNIAMLEYCYDLNIPYWVHDTAAMKEIWTCTSSLIFIVNDMISLQKEISDGQVDNIVPLIMYHDDENNNNNNNNHSSTTTIQEAMDKALTSYLQESYDSFTAAESTLPIPTGDAELDRQILVFVQGCKDMVLGNLYWSHHTERYCKTSQKMEGNRIRLQL